MSYLLFFAWLGLLALKFHSRPPIIAVGLAALAWLALPAQLIAAPRMPLAIGPLLLTCLTAFQFLRVAARPVPPQPGGTPAPAVFLVRLTCVVLAITLALARPPGLLLPAFLLMLTGSLLTSQRAHSYWQRLGVVTVSKPIWAWLLALPSLSAAFTHSPLWLALPLLLRVRPPRPSERLTPGQATLLLRLPLPAVNACLLRIPPDLQSRWFRPDPMRLHLREPLLETANTPAYAAALAGELNRIYRLSPPIEREEQLADFCLAFPHSVAEVLLRLPLEQPIPAEGWTQTNLANLRKPGKFSQLQHFLLVRKIKDAKS